MQAQELIPSSIEDKHQQSRHIKRRNKTNLQLHKQHENKRRQKQRIVKQAHKDQSTTNLYPANTKEVYPRSRDLESVFCWWEEKVYFGFPSKASFGKIPCWDDILPKRGSRRLESLDHLMHAIKVGSKSKSLSIQARRERLITRTNKRKFCHEMSNVGVRMY